MSELHSRAWDKAWSKTVRKKRSRIDILGYDNEELDDVELEHETPKADKKRSRSNRRSDEH